jgi:hypothetical protein
MIKKTFGIIGLGKIDGDLALQAVDTSYQISGSDPELVEELKKKVLNKTMRLYTWEYPSRY